MPHACPHVQLQIQKYIMKTKQQYILKGKVICISLPVLLASLAINQLMKSIFTSAQLRSLPSTGFTRDQICKSMQEAGGLGKTNIT